MATNVTPWQRNQAANSGSERVVVAYSPTSRRRRPGLCSCGTWIHAGYERVAGLEAALSCAEELSHAQSSST